MKALVFAALMVLSVEPAYSDWMDGNDLFKSCELYQAIDKRLLSPLEQTIAGECLTYPKGWLDGHQANAHPLICVPAEVRLGSIVDMVIKYLDDNPGKRHHRGSEIMFNALIEFECPDLVSG